MKTNNYVIWATDLNQEAISLDDEDFILHKSCLSRKRTNALDNNNENEMNFDDWSMNRTLAIVMGNEATGCSHEMLKAADYRVYLPIHGFSDSLNLSVAAAMILQKVFILFPQAIGAMSDIERRDLRKLWYQKLSRNENQSEEFAKLVEFPPLPFRDTRRPNEHRTGWKKMI